MNRTEAYLRRATRGLWGRRRREVREELEAHIADSVRRYRLLGHSEADAEARALADLGHPREVAGGMARLYTLPYLAAPTALLAALAVFAVLLVSESAAQNLEVTYRYPSVGCLEGTAPEESCVTGMPWTSLDALRTALEAQGAQVTERRGQAVLELPGGRSFYLPSQSRIVFTTTYSGDERGSLARGYFPLWELVREIAKASPLPVQFGAWGEPELRFGDLTLRWNDPKGNEHAWNPYSIYMNEVSNHILNTARLAQPERRESLTRGWSSHVRNIQSQTLSLRVNEPGIYGLIVIQDPAMAPTIPNSEHLPDVYVLQSVAPADTSGFVRLGDRTSSTAFVADANDLFAGGRGVVGRALLVRLTGEAWGDTFGYEIVPPDAFEVLNPAD